MNDNKPNKNRQQEIDAKAEREFKAVGADDVGGQDYAHPGQRINKSDQPKPSFKGVRIHDKDHNTWGV